MSLNVDFSMLWQQAQFFVILLVAVVGVVVGFELLRLIRICLFGIVRWVRDRLEYRGDHL